MPPQPRRLILVVEDDKDLAPLLCTQLQKHGFDTHHEPDGLFALIWLQTNQPDIMLVDVMMPRLDGFSFMKAVRYIGKHYKKPFESLPAIMLTAKTDAQSMIKGIQAGCKFFLGKPYNLPDLIKKLQKAIEDRGK